MKTKVPSIPLPTQNNLFDVARAVKGILDVREGYIGDPLDQNVTYRDLIDSGIAQVSLAGYQGLKSAPPIEVPGITDGYNPTTDLTPPDAPTGLAVTSGKTLIKLKWDLWAQDNHAYTEIWRSVTNVIGSAIRIGTSDTQYFVDSLGETGAAYYYWIRFVSQANQTGPYNSTNGTTATSGLIDNADIANLDAAKITSGFISANRIQAGSIDAKIANLDTAVITSGTFDTARIGDATITTAKIASTLQSTNYNAGTAGWKITKAGDMELNNATFRGTLDIKSAATGARTEMTNSVIKVYDSGGVLRVKLGDLSA